MTFDTHRYYWRVVLAPDVNGYVPRQSQIRTYAKLHVGITSQ